MISLRCRNDEDEVVFRGWARMGLPLTSFSIVEVRKPNVGENKPADVFADIVIDISGRSWCLLSPV